VSSTQAHPTCQTPNKGLPRRPEPEDTVWPVLDYPAWRDTAATLQLWTQVVGKVRLAFTPWLNHSWHVPLYVNARGLGTSLIHAGAKPLEIDFDLVNHRLILRTLDGLDRRFALAPMSVAAFYGRLMSELVEASITVAINVNPNEFEAPIRFPDDETHAAYDADAAHAFWRALVRTDRVFNQFRTAFLGKSSLVHFFWGSFELAATRFSGRPAPLHEGEAAKRALNSARSYYVHVVRGELDINRMRLEAGDAVALKGESLLDLGGGKAAEVLVFDLAPV
jgi:Family of unknown function (DUF5996)/Quercetinase C-terminal cupin domain